MTGEPVARGTGEMDLREQLRKWRAWRSRASAEGTPDAAPRCVFGMMTGQRVDEIAGDIEELRDEIGWIKRVIVSTVIAAALATVLRFLGWVRW